MPLLFGESAFSTGGELKESPPSSRWSSKANSSVAENEEGMEGSDFLGLRKNVCLCIQGATSFIGLGNSDEQRWSWAWAWKYRGWPSYSKTCWFSCAFRRIWVIRIWAWSLWHTTNKEMEIKNIPSLGDHCPQIWDFIFIISDPTSPAFIMAKQAEILHTLKF